MRETDKIPKQNKQKKTPLVDKNADIEHANLRTGNMHGQSCVVHVIQICASICEHIFHCSYYRTYTYNDRRYGHYQPNGYGYQYPGQKHPNQYPAGVPLGEDKFKYDPVSRQSNHLKRH